MKRPLVSGNASLLLLLTSAIASCGGTDSVLQSFDGGRDAQGTTEGGSDAGEDSASRADAADDGAPVGDASSDVASDSIASPRRPFLVGASMRSAASEVRGDWSRALSGVVHVDATTAGRLAQTWLKDALEEHASIAAFARLTMQLLSVGAPPELVTRSQQASLDEIHHARTCFALAERYGGGARGPSPLVVHDSLGAVTLAEIAALAAEEGCVGETLGAALAAEQLAVARDPVVVAALAKIARDEARHAELAWRFVAWAVARGGEDVHLAVARAIEAAIESTLAMEIRSYAGIDLDLWHAHGRLTCTESRAVAARAIRELIRPCLAAIRTIVATSDATCSAARSA